MPTAETAPPTTPVEADTKPDLPRLVESVAAHLPGDWSTISPNPRLFFLTQGDFELCLRLIDGARPARIRVSGALPEGYHRVTTLSGRSITASAVRGAAHVAKEINRRLIPGYTTDIAEATAALARRADRLDRSFGSVERVRETLPSFSAWSSERPDQTTYWGPGGPWISYRVLSGGMCDIDLDRVPELVALEVVALIADRLGLAPAMS